MPGETFADVQDGRPLTSWADLVLVGLSHREAGVAVREKLAIPAESLPGVLAQLRGHGFLSGVTVLSTCNRLEIYASAPQAQAAETLLRSYFIRRCPECADHLFVRRGAAAVRHLFRVTAGLDSIVVGEHQILGQVKTFYQTAQQAGHTDKLLNKLFQAAIGAGKQVRSRTGIAQGICSCGGAAVAMAEKVLPAGKDGRRILLVGAGKMAETAAQHMLESRGAALTIANRDVERARTLAAQYGARAVSLEAGMAAIAEMDVIIASTACPHYIVTKERLAALAESRQGRPLVVIDLGVPRNVDPAAASIAGVHLYNIDHLEAVISETLARRRGELQAAEDIVSGLTAEFCAILSREPAPRALAPSLGAR
ncbi:MAG: glutamyl-tRNA reductase [Elusimicrobia bacterium]|nr:glutamyl-tRNA reductase [Elusimicrobiota bacterium]